MSSPKECYMDTVYPEPLSRLRRGHGLSNSCSDSPSSQAYRRAVRKQMRRGNSGSGGRFRTQPITFHEIKEVDEENLAESEPDKASTFGAASKSESDLKAKFELFYRSIGATNNNNEKNSNQNSSVPPSKLSPGTEPSMAKTISSTSACPSAISTCNPTLRKSHYASQDDSSTKSCPINTNLNFNPKSRPSL